MHRLHRLAGLALALPVFLWMGTGLLFHVKHRYGEAYEALAVPQQAPAPWTEARLAPAELVARGVVEAQAPLVLLRHPSGEAAYLGVKETRPVLLSAVDGRALPLADLETSREWARRAVAASAHATRYGVPEGEATEGEHFSTQLGRALPAHVFRFSGGKVVTVNRLTGEVVQTGALNDFIDFTYRLHYLQWTPWRPVNLALLALAVPLMVWLAVSGLRMSVRPARRR